MSEHLLKAGANITPREGDELARLPYLRTWFRTRSAIILHLSNGCVQINFFQVRARGAGAGSAPVAGSWGSRGVRAWDLAPSHWAVFLLLPLQTLASAPSVH